METIIPKTSVAFGSLLRADLTTQWRNRRAVIMTFIVPVLILMTWKPLAATMGGAFVLSNSIVIGLFASGLMGYANTIARDRDKGIFQRLRVGPIAPWTIIMSRLAVQLIMINIITTAVFIIGYQYDGIALTPVAYVVSFITAIMGGAVSLSLGQMVVGYIKNPETVNSTTRLIYLALILTGMLGELYLKKLGPQWADLVKLSPYGVVKTILASGMDLAKWNQDATNAFLLTLGYTFVFTFLGIKWFKWNTK
jgi:ABC-2 type transport system permease protein